MSHSFPVITLPQLFSYEPSHHGLDPLLANNGVLRGLEARRVIVIDAGERGGNGGFASEESGRFRSWHFCVLAWSESETEAGERKVKDWDDVCTEVE